MIELENITVIYRRFTEQHAQVSLKEYIIRRLKNPQKYLTSSVAPFHALNNISLTVNTGETLGIVGRNGAGKSTLLKVISRVLKPTSGRVILRGRIFPLLELSAGFDPELTGRENIFLNRAILGFKKKATQKKLDDIIAFAGLEAFIDTPVRNYSSGMLSRLGFSIVTAVQPDILIVDEALSVGDTAFQKRCTDRIQAFSQNGTTVLLVSHDLETLRKTCQRIAWLTEGRIHAVGTPDDIITRYTHALVP